MGRSNTTEHAESVDSRSATDGSNDETLPDGVLSRRNLIKTGASVGAAGAVGQGTRTVGAQESPSEVNVLVFSATEGWRHGNIEYGNQNLQQLDTRIAEETGADTVTIDVIDEDGTNHDFPTSTSELEQYDVVVWNNTTGSALNWEQQQAFESYMRNGGGFAGIHAAGDTHAEWDFYVQEVVGANFESHPSPQEATITVTDQTHPSTRHLDERWEVHDEWYDYDRNPRGNCHVLATLQEDTYDNASMDGGREDHPIAWCKEVDDGRAWYTGRGHHEQAWDEPDFVEHVLQGILWAGGFVEGDATGTVWDAYASTDVTPHQVREPVAVEVSPDGLVYVVNLDADVVVMDQDSHDAQVALQRDFFSEAEAGGHDLAFDPDFEENGYVYFYYSPTDADLDPNADGPYSVLSRFEVDRDTGEFLESTETELFRVHTQRARMNSQGPLGSTTAAYHMAGGVEFGPEGHLYLSTGDNMTPHHHDGFPPMEEGTNPNWRDARGSSADTSDLRGKILRIDPHDDGSYSIPEGNLFPESEYGSEIDAGTVRPEIYAMGFRNPYRFEVDEETGWIFVPDMGPDSRQWDTQRGPLGTRTYNVIREPANFGWPMVRMDLPWYDYDYSTNQSGQLFDPNGPTNDSMHNDGLTQLPAVDTDQTVAFVATDWQEFLNEPWDGTWSTPDEVPHPELEDTGVIGGPVFRLDHDGGGFPFSLDGKWLIAGFNAGGLHLVSVDDDGQLLDIEPFLPDLDVQSPVDFATTAGGAMYAVDWGRNLEGDAPAILRIEHEPEVVPQAETFELEGEIGGWQGVSPASIAGETNPALPLEPGEEYRVEWTNTDGIGHNFAIRDAQGENLHSTALLSEQGATQSVEFTATEEMDHYVCEPHASAMRGPIGSDGGTDSPLGEPADSVTVGMTGDNAFDPAVAHVVPGGTVTWEYQGGFAHDAVAYHPDTTGTPQRIPDAADPFESGLLDADGDTFTVTFEETGVYDYRCSPHEEAGMVGCVVVGWPDPADEPALSEFSSDVPDGAAEVLSDLHVGVEADLEAGPDLTLDGYEPARPDGEDLFFDVNGDGTVGQDDVVVFFENQHREAWKRPGLFDFSGNGSVGHGDVVSLFEYVSL